MWRVSVTDTCVGSGMCVGIAPGHFRLDRDDRSQPVHGQIEPDDAVLDAADSCPMEAIVLADAETGAWPADGWTAQPPPRHASAASGARRPT